MDFISPLKGCSKKKIILIIKTATKSEKYACGASLGVLWVREGCKGVVLVLNTASPPGLGQWGASVPTDLMAAGEKGDTWSPFTEGCSLTGTHARRQGCVLPHPTHSWGKRWTGKC